MRTIAAPNVIAAAIPHLNAAQFRDFALNNPAFMAITRQRATSYWDAYYRGRYPMRRTYPAIAVLDAIDRIGRAS